MVEIEKLKKETKVKGDIYHLIIEDLKNFRFILAKQKSNMWLNNLLEKKSALKITDIDIERKIRIAKDVLNL